MTNKKITLDNLKDFLEASKADLQDQQKEFNNKYADLIAAVEVAVDFKLTHQFDIAEEEKIAVIPQKDQKPKVMWEKELTDTTEKIYLFNPSLNLDEPKSLGTYAMRVDQYVIRLQDIDKAIKMIDILQKKHAYVKNPGDLIPILRILMLHVDYLTRSLKNNPSQKEEEKMNKQLEVLYQFMEEIKTKENKKTKVKRFFTNIKNKLKKNGN